MLTLIIMVLLGIGFAYFAAQNTTAVDIQLAHYQLPTIPLYILALGSLLLGIFISWIISLANGVSSLFLRYQKDSKIKDKESTIEKLTARLHKVELENAKLKGENPEIQQEEREQTSQPSFLGKLRHKFSV